MLAWLVKFFSFVKDALAGLVIVDRWFVPSASEKTDDAKAEIDRQLEKSKTTGRP